MGIALPQLAPASEDRVSGAQVIDGSLKFDKSRNHYLQFTPTTTGNRRTWTFSCWFRKMEESANRVIFSSYGSGATPWTAIQTTGNNDGRIQATFDAGVSAGLYTAARFRDNGWYHLVWSVDTTQAADPYKSRVYINGVLQTYESGPHPSLNEETKFNLAGTTMYIGYTPNQLFDGHMSQCYFLDGLAIGPGYFGYTDPLTGTWRPKEFVAEGTTVNSGTNWSAGLTGTANSSGLITEMFDGNLSSGSWSDSSGYSVSFPNGGVTASNNIKLYGGSGSANWYVVINGTKTTINAPGGSSPAWSATGVSGGYVDLGPGTLTSIGTEGSGIAQNGEVSGIEIDGVLMRDSTTQNLQFGTNGFYFPMDGNSPIGEDKSGAPSPNDGTNWSSYFTGSHDASNGWGTLYQGSNAFDGNLSTAAIGDENATGLTWTAPGGAIGANATTIRIYGNDDNCPDDYLKINGINYGGLITQGFGPDWTVLKGSGAVGGGITQLESIYIRDNDAGNTHYRWRALEIDGVILIDNQIGNSWTPVNFGGSNSIEKATGAKPILNTIDGGNIARAGVFGGDVSATYTTTSASNVGGKYVFENEGTQPTFSFIRGATYTFDWSASSGHPIRFSTTTQEGGGTATLYSNGVDVTGNVTTITVPHNAPDTLYYYCNVHSGMGNSISVTTDETKADPYAWKNVLALPLVGNDDDVSNSINCTSTAKATSTNNAGVSDARSNFYGRSFYFDGSDDYITPTANADFAFGTGDFTAEAWFYANDIGDYRTILDARTTGASSSTGWIIGQRNSKKIYVYSNGFILESTSLLETGSWNHVAFVRSGSTETLYINGVAEATSTSSRNYSDQNSRIGGEGYSGGGGTYAWNGYISDVRLYKGVAKYTSDFIPASTNPDILPDTPSGVATKSKLKKITNGAVVFDGTDDALVVPDHADLRFGTGAFTVETFVYFNSFDDVYPSIISKYTGGTVSWIMRVKNNGKAVFYTGVSGGTNNESSTNPIMLKKWHHIAIVREGTGSNQAKMYVDGKLVVTTTDDTDYADTQEVTIGAQNASNSNVLNGYMSNVRFIKGTALYTSEFTPPTAPLTNVTNTKLLTCQTPTAYQIAAVAPLVSGINDGTVWSSSIASGSVFRSGFPAADAFNGTTKSSTNDCAATPQQQGKGFTFTFGEGVPFTTLQMQCDHNNGGKVFVNGVDITSQLSSGSLTNTTITGVTSPLTSIRLISTTGDAMYLGSVTIDGTMLVDPVSPRGNSATANFDPFNTDINTVRGQETAYATFNPLQKNAGITLSNGNLKAQTTNNAWKATQTTIGMKTGKFYWEFGPQLWKDANNHCQPGVAAIGLGDSYEMGATNYTAFYHYTGTTFFNGQGGAGTAFGAAWNDNEHNIIGIAFDADTRKVWFSRNGVWQGGGNPSAGTNEAGIINLYGDGTYAPTLGQYGSLNGGGADANFGQKPFRYTPPDGFQPLSLSNAQPEKVIARPDQYVSATLYTGDNNSSQDIDVGFAPDLVWQKIRSQAGDHALTDSVRGINAGYLQSEDQDTEKGNANDGISAFLSNGFRAFNSFNNNGLNWVAWCWKAGGSAGTFNIDDVGYANASDVNMSIGSLNSSFYNTSETWSNGISALSGSLTNPANGFNGNEGDYCDSTAGFTLDLTGHTFGTGTHTIEVKSGGATSFMVVGATNFGFLTDPGGGGAKVWTGTLTGEIYSIISSASGASVYYVKIDGKILVNSGTDLSGLTQYPSIAPTGSSVGTKQGFSIIGYTGTGNNGTLSHGLSQAPEFMILKGRNFSDNWRIYHKDLDATNPANYYLMLESTNGKSANSTNIFNQTMPTSSVFSLGTDSAVNGDTRTMIAYLWHSVPGLQKFGTFTANNSTVGPYVELGFRPSIVWVKAASSAGDMSYASWLIADGERSSTNPVNKALFANKNVGEGKRGNASDNYTGAWLDILSSGFKIRYNGTEVNGVSGQTYIYCAWAEAPSFNLYGGQSNAR